MSKKNRFSGKKKASKSEKFFASGFDPNKNDEFERISKSQGMISPGDFFEEPKNY